MSLNPFHRIRVEQPIREEMMPKDIEVRVPDPIIETPPPPHDPERSAMMSAAAAYDRAARRQAELQELLMKANVGLEAKNAEITRLERVITDERNRFDIELTAERGRVAIFQDERDQAIQDRSDLAAFVAVVKAQFERFELPLPINRRRRAKPAAADNNGGHAEAVAAMPDAGASAEAMAGRSPGVAYIPPVLDGQSPSA
jgi:hypothetical protein